ncbi:MAG TPA: CPBP family intramembrane glutamic endopeptidase [Polyangiaceae bacterium]|nr:CPBP family intramembrane glutamic endopeptidase [Polyangiaceae bacterium]
MSPTLPPPVLAPGPERRPRVWTVFMALAFAAACFGVISAVIVVIYAMIVAVQGVFQGMSRAEVSAVLKEFARSTPGKTISGAAWASLLIGIAVLCAKLSRRGVASRLALQPSRATALDLILGSIGTVAASSAIRGTLGWLAIVTRSSAVSVDSTFLNQIKTEQTPQGIGLTIATVAVVGVIGPISEELFFRGFVQTRLCARWGPLAGIAITSVAFGLFHLPSPAYAVFATFFGAYLGWLAHFGGGTRPAILAHAVNNTIAVTFAVMVARLDVGDRPPSRAPWIVAIAIEAVVAVACVAGMLVIRAIRAQRTEEQPAQLAS